MASIAVYIAMHKPYRTPADSAYIPLAVGKAAEEGLCALCDNTGDNISTRNSTFCELTALYWIWKHGEADTLGLVHYRRYFARKGFRRDPWARVLSAEELQSALGDSPILLPRKRHYIIETTYSQYAHAHHEKDLQLTRQVIETRCPDYLPAFDVVMSQRSGHRFNMFLAKRDVLDRYCSWLFPILFALEDLIDVSGYDAYNRRVFGFIAERLLDVWLYHEKVPYTELPVVNIEGENWLRKGSQFCLRKFKSLARNSHPSKL